MKLKQKLNKLFKNIAKIKNFGNRTASYLVFVNSFFIINTFFAVNNININIFLLLTILVALTLSIGLFDYLFILKHEYQHLNSRNDIKKDTEKILKKLEENE